MAPRRRLEQVAPEHGRAIFQFEAENRAYFEKFISDRGEDYFSHFDERHAELLADQATGRCAYYLLIDEEGAVAGRFNLVEIEHGAAEVGYRVAERHAGVGLATAGLLELCGLASSRHGLGLLRARVADENRASRAVLLKAGFSPTGPAEVGPRRGSWYERRLSDAAATSEEARC